jgi:hypothetical protein
VAWSRDGETIMVQNDLEPTISVFRFDRREADAGPDAASEWRASGLRHSVAVKAAH